MEKRDDGWISVKEAPKDRGTYLVYVFAKHGSMKGHDVQWVAWWNGHEWLDFDPMVDDYIHECLPTHWRPLPDPPEEATK